MSTSQYRVRGVRMYKVAKFLNRLYGVLAPLYIIYLGDLGEGVFQPLVKPLLLLHLVCVVPILIFQNFMFGDIICLIRERNALLINPPKPLSDDDLRLPAAE